MPGEESVECIFERYVEMNAHTWSYLGYVLKQGLEGGGAEESKKEKESHCNTPTCDIRSPFGPTRDVEATLKVKAGVVYFSLAPVRSHAATDTDDFITMFREVDSEKNLTGNWVMDDSEECGRCGMAINHLIPVMDVRYTDDLTVDPTDEASQDTTHEDFLCHIHGIISW